MAGKKRKSRIMTAVRTALKKKDAYLAPEILRELEEAITGRWYEIIVIVNSYDARYYLMLDDDSVEEDKRGIVRAYDSKIVAIPHGKVRPGRMQRFIISEYGGGWCDDTVFCEEPSFDLSAPFVVLKKVRSHPKTFGRPTYAFRHQIIIYAPKTQIAKK